MIKCWTLYGLMYYAYNEYSRDGQAASTTYMALKVFHLVENVEDFWVETAAALNIRWNGKKRNEI